MQLALIIESQLLGRYRISLGFIGFLQKHLIAFPCRVSIHLDVLMLALVTDDLRFHLRTDNVDLAIGRLEVRFE